MPEASCENRGAEELRLRELIVELEDGADLRDFVKAIHAGLFILGDLVVAQAAGVRAVLTAVERLDDKAYERLDFETAERLIKLYRAETGADELLMHAGVLAGTLAEASGFDLS